MATYTKDELKQLFDDCEWEKSLDGSIELAKETPFDSELYVILANSYLYMNAKPIENEDEIYYSACKWALDRSDSLEQSYQMFSQLIDKFYTWQASVFSLKIKELIANPSFDNFVPSMTDFITQLDKMENRVRHWCFSGDNFIKTKHEALLCGKSTEELEEKFLLNVEKPDYELIKYIKMSDWFNNTLNYYVKNGSQYNSESAKTVAHKLLLDLSLIDLVVDLLDPDETDTEFLVEKYKLLVRVKAFSLEVVLTVGDNLLSLISDIDQRQKLTNEITELNRMIYTYDANYEPIDIPRLEPYLPQNHSTKQSSGGCYVATAVYGSYDCPEVWTLRRYRDDILSNSWYGRLFIYLYYAISPTIVKLFGNTTWFKNMWRGKLNKMVSDLQKSGIESTPYEDKIWKKEK